MRRNERGALVFDLTKNVYRNVKLFLKSFSTRLARLAATTTTMTLMLSATQGAASPRFRETVFGQAGRVWDGFSEMATARPLRVVVVLVS